MSVHTFASIYIGSYELTLKIFEFTAKKKMKEIDCVRTRTNLGKDIYHTESVGYETVEQLCDTLQEFLEIAKSYRANATEVYMSVAIRDASNELFVLDQIQIRTGIRARVLSNSEHRFITYETIAGRERFAEAVEDAAFVDIGGSGIQITLFRNGEIITTQHMDLGTIRLRNMLRNSDCSMDNYRRGLAEFIDKKIEVFRAMYLKQDVSNLILISDYGDMLLSTEEEDQRIVRADKFAKMTQKLLKKPEFGYEDPFVVPSLILFHALATSLGCKLVYVPGTNICDGIAFDYGRRKNLLLVNHSFEDDVLSASRNLAEHFKSYSPHIEALNRLATDIFTAMKKVHGLNKRHLLLLRVATLLHDVGKYVSISNGSISAYNIIMESEIIGLTHRERSIVAYTVLFNTLPLMKIDELPDPVDEESYIVFAKLSAILRVANALDQSHKQKFDSSRIILKDRELLITVEASEDLTLERALFANKTQYFEDVFSIKPVLKEKRVYRLRS
ncbi:MAG: phosphatase [Agathobacter sp.]|uniref:Ppx/GppA phosphatase family protein n=1 Tax=Agathobacter sp. TaxID=2021311 RepID=UPI00257A6E65|nr:phosphatase [Agathobacter sp.]MBQ1682275.1 phosphatase [Agathobacter sp.]